MANRGQRGLELLAASLDCGKAAPPPVERWNPSFCGDIDMRIGADGTWYYRKTPIGRPALVKLFASVLVREGDRYFLVTPVEKLGISVDDAPLMAVEMAADADEGQILHFRTNTDDLVTAGPGHELRFEPEAEGGGLKPYLHVRRGLWAKVTRALTFDLVACGEERIVDGRAMFGVSSNGVFFPMAEASTLRETT